jgi:hypothetical protein
MPQAFFFFFNVQHGYLDNDSIYKEKKHIILESLT